MRMAGILLFFSFIGHLSGGAWLQARSPSGIPDQDVRFEIRDLNSPCGILRFGSRQDWLKRAAFLRRQILVSAGLWPLPAKTPLNPHIFGRVDYEDYSMEKVYFESYPGYYVTGNLYRPRGKRGPFPAIAAPHGHWAYGRLENSERGSVPARAIHFARQGAIVFTYDMVGYNDSFQVSHEFRGAREELWGVGLLGLQLWNSIRTVDFLLSLPDVDKERLAATGASGGGTQTFLLTAVDKRIKVSAPVNMISGHMQGGDICENAPGLRVDTCNIETGALMAPRPMLMVSATGDWTTDTPRIEYPGIRHIYELFGEEDKVANSHFHAPHNYNRRSREAVYTWFARRLFGQKPQGTVKEKGYRLKWPSEHLVFFGRPTPEGAKTQQQLVEYLIHSARQRWESLKPRNAAGVDQYRRTFEPSLRYALMVERPDPAHILAETKGATSRGGESREELLLSYRGSRIRAVLWRRGGSRAAPTVLVVHPQGSSALLERGTNRPGTLVRNLLRSRFAVLAIDVFKTSSVPEDSRTPEQEEFFTTYNRSDDANRIQDILTALAYLGGRSDVTDVTLVGMEKAGLWCLLARGLAPGVRGLAADAVRFDADDDQSYLRELPLPGIRQAGDFRTAVTLAAPGRLLLHNTGANFPLAWAQDVYRAAGTRRNLEVRNNKISERDLLRWLRSGR